MALRKMDGFDLYADITGVGDNWSSVGTPSFSTSLGRFNGGAIVLNSSTDAVYVADDSGDLYQSVACSFKWTGGAAAYILMVTTAAGNRNGACCAVRVNVDGSLTLVRGTGAGTADIASSAAGLVSADTYYWLEMRFYKANAGSAELYLSGAEVIASTAADTLFGTSWFCCMGATGTNSATVYCDDFVYRTDPTALPAALGDMRISTLLPNADTAVADWAKSTGVDGYAMIDDPTGTNGDGDSTYISATAGTSPSPASEFDVQDLSSTPTSIEAIAVKTRSSKTDAGTAMFVPYVDSSGATAYGTETNPSETSYGMTDDYFETDPNTGIAWTDAAIDALKVGVEITG